MRSRAWSLVLGLLVFAGASNLRAQEAEVSSAIQATLEAYASGDFESFVNQYHSEARGFFLDGGVLLQGFNLAALQAVYNAGFRADVTVRDIDVQVHGSMAVAVAYLNGSLSLPGGVSIPGTWRYSETRIQEGGSWKIVQFHVSEQRDALGIGGPQNRP